MNDKIQNIENAGLDTDAKQFCIDKLKEIVKITDILGCETQISELADGLPTVFIGLQKNYKKEDTVGTCTFLPLDIKDNAYLLLQYNILLNLEVPDENREEVNLLIKAINERFLMGTLVLYESEMSLKYAVYVKADESLDQILFARTLEILTIEADEILKKVDRLIAKTATLEQLSVEDTFSN